VLHGICKEYYDNGTLKSEGHYLNEERHGIWKWYYREGALEQESHYLNNDLMSQKSYYKDGITLKEEYDGFLWFKYNEDGTITYAFYEIQHEDEDEDEDEDEEGGGVEKKYLTEEEIECYNKVIFSVGRETWKAIPRELFDYLISIEIF
jgi:antitoxin component YwqK of YwqJK toxin-antitoxin module